MIFSDADVVIVAMARDRILVIDGIWFQYFARRIRRLAEGHARMFCLLGRLLTASAEGLDGVNGKHIEAWARCRRVVLADVCDCAECDHQGGDVSQAECKGGWSEDSAEWPSNQAHQGGGWS